jgi:hypothetical protein
MNKTITNEYLLPPSQPSPIGEGVSCKAFPPWGKQERGSSEIE